MHRAAQGGGMYGVQHGVQLHKEAGQLIWVGAVFRGKQSAGSSWGQKDMVDIFWIHCQHPHRDQREPFPSLRASPLPSLSA